ncbi:DNA cytosine methyltransferase [Roseibium sp.]|uniref:DNA cytosine methyltransferase n=1 Tax=Roseibium sp. TaxID=1936156 RepID=UPI003B5155C7
MKKKKMLVADLLCGAGGSSTGCQRALAEMGLEMELVCLNHWPTAIETHQKNHPEARHYVQDISTVRPHLVVPEGYLDLLMASPTCTHHSVARGGKPTSDQQRSDPWHIVTWLTELRVKRIIIENVWEFTSWGPVNRQTGKPVKSRKGEYFHAWIQTIKGLGFDLEWRKLNAADYGDATTRQRFILMGRSDGKKVHWPMPTHRRPKDLKDDMFATEKPWRPARDIIDWSIKGKSIFGRRKDLAPKTMARIYAGAVKFNWPEPYLVILRNHMAARGLDLPLPTIAANGTHIGLAEPVVVNMKKATAPATPKAPLPTLTSAASHIGIAEPVIMNGRKGNQAKPASQEPVPTLDTKGGVWLAEPVVLSQHSSGAPRSAEDPLPTITTGGAGTNERPGCARPMLVEPFMLSQASGGSPRGVSEPMPTQTTGGNGSAHALISPYYGSGSGETCDTTDNPLPTVTSKGRFGMVVPVTNSNGGAQARNLETDPLPTMTTARGGEFAAVLPVTHAGGEGRIQNVSDPLPTVTGANRGELAMVEPDAEFDILFRMLEPHELAAAMGFNTEEARYEFAGTKTDKIKQIGNAVSVAKMKACVSALLADAAPKAEFLEAAE